MSRHDKCRVAEAKRNHPQNRDLSLGYFQTHLSHLSLESYYKYITMEEANER